jgi:hypothetical protein
MKPSIAHSPTDYLRWQAGLSEFSEGIRQLGKSGKVPDSSLETVALELKALVQYAARKLRASLHPYSSFYLSPPKLVFDVVRESVFEEMGCASSFVRDLYPLTILADNALQHLVDEPNIEAILKLLDILCPFDTLLWAVVGLKASRILREKNHDWLAAQILGCLESEITSINDSEICEMIANERRVQELVSKAEHYGRNGQLHEAIEVCGEGLALSPGFFRFTRLLDHAGNDHRVSHQASCMRARFRFDKVEIPWSKDVSHPRVLSRGPDASFYVGCFEDNGQKGRLLRCYPGTGSVDVLHENIWISGLTFDEDRNCLYALSLQSGKSIMLIMAPDGRVTVSQEIPQANGMPMPISNFLQQDDAHLYLHCHSPRAIYILEKDNFALDRVIGGEHTRGLKNYALIDNVIHLFYLSINDRFGYDLKTESFTQEIETQPLHLIDLDQHPQSEYLYGIGQRALWKNGVSVTPRISFLYKMLSHEKVLCHHTLFPARGGNICNVQSCQGNWVLYADPSSLHIFEV